MYKGLKAKILTDDELKAIDVISLKDAMKKYKIHQKIYTDCPTQTRMAIFNQLKDSFKDGSLEMITTYDYNAQSYCIVTIRHF